VTIAAEKRRSEPKDLQLEGTRASASSGEKSKSADDCQKEPSSEDGEEKEHHAASEKKERKNAVSKRKSEELADDGEERGLTLQLGKDRKDQIKVRPKKKSLENRIPKRKKR